METNMNVLEFKQKAVSYDISRTNVESAVYNVLKDLLSKNENEIVLKQGILFDYYNEIENHTDTYAAESILIGDNNMIFVCEDENTDEFDLSELDTDIQIAIVNEVLNTLGID